MAFTAGTILSAAALNEATGLTAETPFTTSSPAGAGWYRLTAGGMVEFHYESTGNVTSGSEVTITTLPANYRPAGLTALAASGGVNGTRPAAAAIDSAGAVKLRNNYSSDIAVQIHGLFMVA